MIKPTIKEYIKQLNIQKYYLVKFSLNYASGWLRQDVTKLIKAIDNELILYQGELLKIRNKYKQMSFFDDK